MADEPGGVGVADARPPQPFRPVAATVGTVAAGVMLAALFVPGGTDGTVRSLPLAAVARAAAAVAVLAFAARRRLDLPRKSVGVLAIVAGLIVAAADLATLFGALHAWGQPLGLPVATAAALPVVGMGAAMALGLSDATVYAATRDVTVATGIGGVGYVATQVGAVVLSSLAVSIAGVSASNASFVYPVVTVAAGVSAVAFAAFAIQWLGHDWSWVDLSLPSARGVGLAVAGVLALVVGLQLLSMLAATLGLPSAESSVEQAAERSGEPGFLLVMIPLSFLFIAPSEELLYRGVVQKYLYDSLGEGGAVVAASSIFAVIHFGQYADPNPLKMAVSLTIVFLLSLILGYVYVRSENLVVPILVHGAYNALTFYQIYVGVTGGP